MAEARPGTHALVATSSMGPSVLAPHWPRPRLPVATGLTAMLMLGWILHYAHGGNEMHTRQAGRILDHGEQGPRI